MILDDEALVEQVVTAMRLAATREFSLFMQEVGEELPDLEMRNLATAAIEAVRVHMWDDGK